MALHDLVALNWKADNGFRPGYGTKVYEVMKREIPTIQIRVNPHINSKVSTWKRDYHSLCLILDRSGVGFNSNGSHKIECNDEQWAQIVKADSHAKYMRYKAWPYWEDWKVIFGKDRGDGVGAEDVCEADDTLNAPVHSVADESEPNMESQANMSPYSLNDFYTEEQILEGIDQAVGGGDAFGGSAEAGDAVGGTDAKSVKSPVSMKKTARKRKPEEVFECMLDVMTKMHDDTSQRLTTLSSRIGYDFDLSAKRVEVAKMLDGIPLITQKQKFMACDIPVKEPERLDLFTGFSAFDKADYIIHILEEKLAK